MEIVGKTRAFKNQNNREKSGRDDDINDNEQVGEELAHKNIID